jgi:hypothetical protein
MKTILAFGFCFVYFIFSNAQQEWVSGSVVLKDNEVLVGEISKRPVHELILVNSQEGIKVLPANHISYYRFYDEQENINRQFLSVKSNDIFGSHRFYEIVIQGKVKVLRKYHKRSEFMELHEAKDFDYFVLLDEQLIPLTSFKRKILPRLQSQHPVEISAFLSMNKLELQSMKVAFEIIHFYNKIDYSKELLAQFD